MKRLISFVVVVCSLLFVCQSCESERKEIRSEIIEGLMVDNYPNVDGSTSSAPLNMVVACKLLGVDYRWVKVDANMQGVEPRVSRGDATKLSQRIKSSQTHGSIVNLINKEADLVLSARKISDDEQELADKAGVTVVETPVALDAFVFIVHPDNPIKSLTIEQIQGIYTGEITNWKDVGGKDERINAYVRNANSGSQELMESLVMKDLEISDFPESPHELIAFSMSGAFESVLSDKNSICYTVYYYKENIITEHGVKGIAVNSVYPDKKTIGSRAYPFTAEVYAMIRTDLDKSSMAYKVYEWHKTELGRQAIDESGYIPY